MKDAKNTLNHRSSLIFIKFPITDSLKCSLGSTLPCVHTHNPKTNHKHAKPHNPLCRTCANRFTHSSGSTSSCNYQSILALFSAPNKRRFALRRVFIFGTAKSIMGSNGDEFGIFCRWCVLEDHPRSIPHYHNHRCCEQAGSGLWFISRSLPSGLSCINAKIQHKSAFSARQQLANFHPESTYHPTSPSAKMLCKIRFLCQQNQQN